MSTRLQEIEWRKVHESGVVNWVDPHFKAGRDAILDPMIVKEKRILNWENFIWKRPSEIYGEGNFNLFNDIKPEDIKQGHCGNCYYLSCLSSLAEHPLRIFDIFVTKRVN